MSSGDDYSADNFHLFAEAGDISSPCSSCSSESDNFIAPISSQVSLPTVPTSSQPPLTPTTPGISSPFSEGLLIHSPPESPVLHKKRSYRHRKRNLLMRGHRFFGNQYSKILPSEESVPFRSSQSRKRAKISPHRGYTSRVQRPRPNRPRETQFIEHDQQFSKTMHIPTGMRIIDMTILSQAISTLRCSFCNQSLGIFEEEFQHGWQTFFRIKCKNCHMQHVSFPSSRPLDLPSHHTPVNVPQSHHSMNEITLRSIIATHTTGMSWRDLHRFSTVFDLPAPLVSMPSRYLDRLESATKNAVSISMSSAADDLRIMVDSQPSAEENATNVTVSFDSSWHTRGFYSNIGFGSAISTKTKKVLDYEILSRNCEKCAPWNEKKIAENPDAHERWLERHKPNCNRNYFGSSQGMEGEAAKRIWSRSLDRHLVFSTFVGDGDSKSFSAVTSLDPYPLVKVEKQECLNHVTKRLKKSLMRIKSNTETTNFVQHKLTQWKADYISSNYSTVVIQNRGRSAEQISQSLSVLLSHSAGDHSKCPTDRNTWCRWKKTSDLSNIPKSLTTFSAQDIMKVTEEFHKFASQSFCSHLTLALTQNSNESLHNSIWALSPKSKYISPQSIRISTAIAILIRNEGERALYALFDDLQLRPTYHCYNTILRRIRKLDTDRESKQRANFKRRRRQQRQAVQAREASLVRGEGGPSYKSAAFGVEQISTPARLTRRRGRGSKRSIADRDLLTSSSSCMSSSSDDTDSDTECPICNKRQPEAVALRNVMKGKETLEADWVQCDICSIWYHCYCVEVDPTGVKNKFWSCHQH